MQRIKALDFARGFTVLFIPIVHSVMLYGNSTAHTSVVGHILRFIAEWPGAQLFMLLMGVLFALPKRNSFTTMLFKSCILLSAGYLLNLIKFVIPLKAGLLPHEFVIELGNPKWYILLLTGDILQFAGLSLPILYAIKQLPNYPIVAALLVFVICAISPLVWDIHHSQFFLNYLLQLAGGKPPFVFFPLFPWLVYPLAGLAIGGFIRKAGNRAFVLLLPVSICLIATGISLSHSNQVESFYRTGFEETLLHLGFVILWLSAWHFFSLKFPDFIFSRILTWLSRRITIIYIVQWPLVCWVLPVIGYHSQGIVSSTLCAVAIAAVTFWIAKKVYSIHSHIKR